MSRKATILAAVFVNSTLLLLLFITARVTKEEILLENKVAELSAPPMQEMLVSEERIVLEERLPQDIAFKTPEPLLAETVAVVETKPVLKAIEEPVVKELPRAPSLQEVVVKKGDTLEKIARSHKVTVQNIIDVNRLPSSFLRIGQILKIPAVKEKAVAEVKQKETTPSVYVVQVGDSPWTIAMKHGMKVSDLLKINGLDEKKAKRLKPGDKLKIR